MAEKLVRGDVVVIPPGKIEFKLLEDPGDVIVKAKRLEDGVVMPLLVQHLKRVR